MHELTRPRTPAEGTTAKPAVPKPVLARVPATTKTPLTSSRGEPVTRPVVAGRVGAPPQKTVPDPQAQAQKLSIVTTGTRKKLINSGLARDLDNNPTLRTLIGNVGTELTANALMGTTRRLATLPRGAANKVQNYAMPVINETLYTDALKAQQQAALARSHDQPINPIAIMAGAGQGADLVLKSIRDGLAMPATGTAAIRQQLEAAKKNGTLPATLAAFKTQTGKSLYAVLGEQVRNPAERAKLLKLLPSPLPKAQLTRDAFLENIAVGFAYSDLSGKDLNTSNKPGEKGGTASQVLKAFHYSAGDPQNGGWGMQLRVFTPDPLKAKGQPVVIVFRGTDGVAFDMKTNPSGTVDTVNSDMARAQPGYNQFANNKGWIDAVVKQATANGQKVTFVGHSLGSALAQQAAARYAPHTAGVVTFQGANIAQADVDKVAAYNKVHPNQPIASRNYRVDGDTVPTSGEASLPGSIHYFDRVSRPAGSQADMGINTVSDNVGQMSGGVKKLVAGNLASRVPMLSLETATSGHTIPILNTYLRGQGGTPMSAQEAALTKYGIRDTNSYASPVMKDGKPVLGPDGKPKMTAVQDVGVVYGGDYNTKHDPRVVAEAQRSHVMPEVMAALGADVAVFKGNIAYNTALHHLFDKAGGARTFAEFQAEAASVLNQEKLAMVPVDIELARQMNLDKSPRANMEYAIKDLIGVDASKVQVASRNSALATVAVGVGMPGLAGPLTDLSKKVDAPNKYIQKFSTIPTMDEYKVEGEDGKVRVGEYEVEISNKVKDLLLDPDQQRAIWRLYHPSGSK
jgi:Lipase (class 3)